MLRTPILALLVKFHDSRMASGVEYLIDGINIILIFFAFFINLCSLHIHFPQEIGLGLNIGVITGNLRAMLVHGPDSLGDMKTDIRWIAYPNYRSSGIFGQSG